ncbi:pseudouridine synthase [Paucihalobacter ruber]|uniref:Pseudouridine synthase n=1 Tax=Paucihalobacter ruber TaxID=2567861 RepID=A0A506PJY3_9FLAO|nr:pseudouridine synthase [Paucihalobacter ruber]TPV33437.1 pseudouridine synthase [Paucihalobacter ruber]
MIHEHYIIYKPYGYLSQFVNNQTKRKNKKLLGSLFSFPEGSMAVGRLDEKSEGLLIITTDGQISEQIRSKKVEKEYWVMVDGQITSEACNILANGIEITTNDGIYKTLPCKVLPISTPNNIPERKVRDDKHGVTSWMSITICEGKFRQIRKMTSKVGFPTLRLVRVRVGSYSLETYSNNFIQSLSGIDIDFFF